MRSPPSRTGDSIHSGYATTKGGVMRADAGRAEIVGRADVLAQLDSVVDHALAGRSGALLLAGEAGIGKTTLLSAAAERAEAGGARVARAWGWAGGAPAFWLWR